MEDEMKLKGKRIVVLGGTSGIGLAAAQAAAGAGAQVVVVSRTKRRVQQALAALPPGAEGHAVDLARDEDLAGFFARCDRFDHLVFTAGESLQLALLETMELAAARRFFELRYWAALAAAKQAAPRIRPGGSIVLTSGTAVKTTGRQ
jgi:NAD(P)-dependent dehydrogenase (short-subunit alcohol dehydrogenase family)